MASQDSDGGSVIAPGAEASDPPGTPTIVSAGSPGPSVAAGDLPVTGWNRFLLLERLGAGAMGEVYKARDNRIGRLVAIKFVLGAHPRAWMRFRAEAEAQVRIVHANVCRVYEVDEVAGRPYIAMQLVDGEPLRAAASRMSLADKLAAIRDAARGIQEVHRQGVVHRDVTPANVMVEQRDGRWVGIVTDFGLARETAAEAGLTESGTVLGTPAYMSPEQARGDVRTVDRRTDIYGLGATLYDALTGQPPFSGESRTAVIAQVIHDEPAAPRRVAPGLPIDLEIIALKCLAKEPAQRYASAQELADDLDRYLAGESILGRRPPLWHRLRRRARRHRALVVLGAVSLAAVLTVAALGARAWLAERARTTARALLAERLGRETKDIELFMRSAYQLPLQDMRPMRDVVRKRMQAIAATRHDLGALGDAVVHDALGRGHLALHEWQAAADELARAAEIGPAGLPGLHAARGRALGELYHDALDDARRSGDRTWLARRRQELERRYLTPALAELALSIAAGNDGGNAGDSVAYLVSLIALYRDEFAAAERIALDAAATAPWLFELDKLAGDAAYGAAMAAFDHGDYDVARAGLERAGLRYDRAGEIARADASIHEAAAQAALQHAEADVRQRRSPRAALERARDRIDRALRADPDHGTAYITKTYILLRWLRTRELREGQDELALHEAIEATAQRAVDLAPRDAAAWDARGNGHVFRGSYENYHDGDGTPWLHRALADFQAALDLRSNDPWATKDMGMAHRWIGEHLDETGQDAMPDYLAAVAAYRRARELDPDYVFARSGLADVHAEIAEHLASRGRDPRSAADDARRAGEACLQIDHSFAAVLISMARAQLALARYALDKGDPSAALAAARGYLDRGEQLGADLRTILLFRLVAAGIEAELALRDRGDPGPALAGGRVVRDRLLPLDPDSVDVHVQIARFALADARSAARGGRDPQTILASAVSHAAKATQLSHKFAEAYLVAAMVCVERASAQRSRDALAGCRSDVDAALERNPALVEARRLRTTLDERLHGAP